MNSSNKTFLPTQNYKNRNWFIIDCKGQSLGRLATTITSLLKGKVKPQYHPSVDTGDYIILINADSIVINEDSKHYLVYNPGRPGRSLKIKNVSDCLPKLTIERAVKRMLSKTETKRLMILFDKKVFVSKAVSCVCLVDNKSELKLVVVCCAVLGLKTDF